MKSYLKLISAMLIYGTMGIFVRAIALPSNEIVMGRTAIGGLFLTAVWLLRRPKPDAGAFLRQLPLLLASGAVLGLGWVFLFESYRYTTVSAATLLYYCAPILVIIACRLLFKETLSPVKVSGIAAAMLGMILVSGTGLGGINPTRGLIFGLLAAVLYAAFVVLNKSVRELSGLEITIAQLFIACVITSVYALFTHQGSWTPPSGVGLAALVTLGVVHTGIAGYFYFTSMRELPAQTLAALCYIDPLSALLFSAVFLSERLSPIQLAGAALMLGGAAASELIRPKRPAGTEVSPTDL